METSAWCLTCYVHMWILLVNYIYVAIYTHYQKIECLKYVRYHGFYDQGYYMYFTLIISSVNYLVINFHGFHYWGGNNFRTRIYASYNVFVALLWSYDQEYHNILIKQSFFLVNINRETGVMKYSIIICSYFIEM